MMSVSRGIFREKLQPVVISVALGILAGYLSSFLPTTVTYGSFQVGDVYAPLLGLKKYLAGEYVYRTIRFDDVPVVAYPFTAMLSLYPLTFADVAYVAPIFCAAVTSVFTYALLKTGGTWRLLALLSLPFISALHSVQFVPLMAAAVLLPSLLPIVSLKPQLGIVLLAAGCWSAKRAVAALAVVLVSLILYPAWPIDWMTDGNLACYDGRVPVSQGVGWLVLLCLFKVDDKRGRILLLLSLTPQRLWYDQLMLFLVPEQKEEMLVLLAGSWLSWLLSIASTTSLWNSGSQDPVYWKYVVLLQFIPALVIVFRKELLRTLHPERLPLTQPRSPL